MSYSLQAVLGHVDILRPEAQTLGARVVELSFELALLPLSDAWLKSLPGGEPVDGFLRLTAGLERWAKGLSQKTPIAYVEARFLERPGTQAAVVWRLGKSVIGPLRHEDKAVEQSALRDWPINQALRELGVRRAGKGDEFDRLGLGRHRHTEDWERAGS